MEPGIYFGLPEEEYHAVPALSNSGIKNLLVSPLDFWVNSPMNPDYADKKNGSMTTGTAYHRCLLEPARIDELYVPALDPAAYPEALRTAEEIKARLDHLGLKKTGKKGELVERLVAADPNAVIWDTLVSEYGQRHAGKIFLSPDTLADMKRMAEIVWAHRSAAMALQGGIPEVSIFWTDEETGVPMKCRADYLKTKAVVDIKSFTNSLSKPVDVAIAQAVANQRYHVQAAVYTAGVEAAKKMIFKRKMDAIRMGGDGVETEWLTSFIACRQHAFVFVFIQQGPVTNVRVREFRPTEGAGGTQNASWQSGYAGYRHGVKTYARYMAEFGPDKPWIDDQPMRPFADQEFPLYMMD